MPVHLHLMDRGRALPPEVRKRLLGPVRAALDVLGERTLHLDADLAVVPTDIYEDPRWYRSGKAFGPGFAQVEVNTDHPRFSTDWADEGEAIVLHELHHCLRWPHASGQWTLGEIAVLEGLAMLAEEASSTGASDYGNPPPPQTLAAVCERTWQKRHALESAETAWFRDTRCGATELDAPVNYHIGRSMMQDALARLQLDPFEAASLPADELLAAARVP